ncbi:tetratricopeptide repeat protein [Arthrobacter ruber]|uniref:tetratricopeptide repeat protein n=1 Tax=Arthrobacter ruber TaxID=1258893 RepID=UPI001473638E|nr:tetratricopeptide repeat protein [Arthrobacter ruber]
MKSDAGPQWQVFISHTSELQEYPQGGSYIDAVKGAISRAGHVIVDMAEFPSTNAPPAEECIRRAQDCDVFLGVLGARYGSWVKGGPNLSYTELEYEAATEADKPRLMFAIDLDAPSLGIPPNQLIDPECWKQQKAFRDRITGMTQRFTNPDHLAMLVADSLQKEKERQAEEARKRIDNDIDKERQPASQPAARASKFINRPPATAPIWFQDRVVETGLTANWLTDPGTRMITIIGRGGMGKTAIVCRLLKALEAGQLPDLTQRPVSTAVGGIVYLSPTGDHGVSYPHLVNDLCKLLPPNIVQIIKTQNQDPRNSPTQIMRAVLAALPRDEGPVIVLLDNLESVMNTAQERLAEGALHEALQTVLSTAEHPLKLLVTTRVAPTGLLEVQPGAQQQIWLEEGLGPKDARTVLRALDPGGSLGLEQATDKVLNQLQEHTRGFPRALEAVKGILAANRPKLTPQNLVQRTADLPANKVVEALVGQAYQALDARDQRVMQAVAVYPSPVAAVGVDFLLQPYDPTINTTPILDRLVRWQLVRYDPGHDHYYLHPVDRDYAHAQIPLEALEGTEFAHPLAAFQARAADYYAQIRTPREVWHSIDDVFPQLAEFELRCEVGGYDTAAEVLDDIDGELQTWGHYRTVIELHTRLHGHLTDSGQNMRHLLVMGNCQHTLGNYPEAADLYDDLLVSAHENNDPWNRAAALGSLARCHYALDRYPQAIELLTQALAINREIRNRSGEATNLGNLGGCHAVQGNYPRAIELLTQALAINREIRNRSGEATNQGSLGYCHAVQGNYPRAIELHTQALAINREIGNRSGEATNLGNLGACHTDQSDYPKAIELHTQALAINREIGNRSGEATNLGSLGACNAYQGDYPKAIELHTQALAINREIGNRSGEATNLDSLGACHAVQGDYPKAIELHTQAQAINRETGNRRGEATNLGSLGYCHADLGDYPKAIELHTQAQAINREIGNRRGEAANLGSLGYCHAVQGDYTKAIELHTQAQAINRETGGPYVEAAVLNFITESLVSTGNPQSVVVLLEEALDLAETIDHSQILEETRSQLAEMRLKLGVPALALPLIAQGRKFIYPPQQQQLWCLKGIALSALKQFEQAHSAFLEAVHGTDRLLGLAPTNVSALTVRALAYCGLALTGAPHRRDEAVQELGQLRAAISDATGILTDVKALLMVLSTNDPEGILKPAWVVLQQ